ncbi:hypothetical protein F5884DRAFT_463603 [Xylogone sp. PMI_703]|nr:hypothetical protein F5884DRAFT_463603 [Xylogone sp. PMI_703]
MSSYPTPPPTISPKFSAKAEQDSHTYFAHETQSPDSYAPVDGQSYIDPLQSQSETPRRPRSNRTDTAPVRGSVDAGVQGHKRSQSNLTDPSPISYVTAPQASYVPPPQGEADSYFHPSNPPTPDPNADATAALAAAYLNPIPPTPLMPEKPYVPPPQGEAHSYFNPSNAPTPVNEAPITTTPPPFIAPKPPRSPKPHRPSRHSPPAAHGVPSPYNGSRPKPRRGFVKRMWKKFTRRLRKILEWMVDHPIKASLIAVLPAFLIAGLIKVIKSFSHVLEAGLKSFTHVLEAGVRQILIGLGWNPPPRKRSKKGSGGKGGSGRSGSGSRNEYILEDSRTTNWKRVNGEFKEKKVRKDVYIEREQYYGDDEGYTYRDDDYTKAGYLPRVGFYADEYDVKQGNIPKGGYHVDTYGSTTDNTPRGALYGDEFDVKETYTSRDDGYGFGGGYGGSYQMNEVAIENKAVEKRWDDNRYGYLDYGYEEYRDIHWEDSNNRNMRNNDYDNDVNNYTRNDRNDYNDPRTRDADNEGNNRDTDKQSEWFGGVFNDFKGFGGTKAGSIDGMTKLILMFITASSRHRPCLELQASY